jgi:hypothetical protein
LRLDSNNLEHGNKARELCLIVLSEQIAERIPEVERWFEYLLKEPVLRNLVDKPRWIRELPRELSEFIVPKSRTGSDGRTRKPKSDR